MNCQVDDYRGMTCEQGKSMCVHVVEKDKENGSQEGAPDLSSWEPPCFAFTHTALPAMNSVLFGK